MLGMGFDRFSTTLCVRSLCHPQQRWRDTKGLAAGPWEARFSLANSARGGGDRSAAPAT